MSCIQTTTVTSNHKVTLFKQTARASLYVHRYYVSSEKLTKVTEQETI